MSKNYQKVNNLKVDEELLSFVNNDLLKDTGISPQKFWLGFDEAAHLLSIKNKELLEIRNELQKININDYTNPINVGNNFLIIKINEKNFIDLKLDEKEILNRMINIEKKRQYENF